MPFGELRYLSFVELRRYCQLNTPPPKNHKSIAANPTGTDSYFCRYWGIELRTWARWKADNRLTIWAADYVAVDRLGVHPSLIWGEAWWTIEPKRSALYRDKRVGIG